MKRLLNQLMPFFILGVVIVILISGAVLISYLIFFGLIAGFILYLINYLQNSYRSLKHNKQKKQKKGRVIDSDDWHILP